MEKNEKQVDGPVPEQAAVCSKQDKKEHGAF